MTERICHCCADFRKNIGHRMCADRCLWCQARLIQLIQRSTGIEKQEKTTRCKAVIQRVLGWELSEQRVRDLAKKADWSMQPEPEKINQRGTKK